MPLVVGGGGQRYHYEPSTSTLITRSPLVRDPYEQRYVYVKESGLPMAGEGLYAKTNIKKVSLLIKKKNIFIYLQPSSNVISFSPMAFKYFCRVLFPCCPGIFLLLYSIRYIVYFKENILHLLCLKFRFSLCQC